MVIKENIKSGTKEYIGTETERIATAPSTPFDIFITVETVTDTVVAMYLANGTKWFKFFG